MAQWKSETNPTYEAFAIMNAQIYKVLYGCAYGAMSKNEAREIIRRDLNISISFDNERKKILKKRARSVIPNTSNQRKRQRRARR